MKIKGGRRKKSASGSTEVVMGSIQDAMDGGEVHGGDSDYVDMNTNNNPINGGEPSTSHLSETHQEQNLDEPDEQDEQDEQDGTEAAFDAQRTNLDDGFYEIEAIRRKRVRKGQLQYLIKWRGWPETANTWEPLENLHTCSEFIEAFEESLISGKQRKRKRKHGVVHVQTKKRQQRANFSTYNVTDVEISVVDQRLPSAPINIPSLTNPYARSRSVVYNHEGEKNGDVTAIERGRLADIDNAGRNATQRFEQKKAEHEYDPKLSELKATVLTNIAIGDKLAIDFHDARTTENNIPAAGLSKTGSVELVTENRCTGAKRRKSGSVKRFRQDSTLSELPVVQNPELTLAVVESGVGAEPIGVENSGYHGESLSWNNRTDEARNEPSIIKIVKPLGCSASVSNNIQDVLVTFVAMRSDGTEVMVDNKFLKANNPLLLINFYEQHLHYTTRS
ncbi:chromo domain-containing protein LHP1-like [Cucurbita moschata]|uniref:Chromo domain-containing protein LHP1-like n=1 Tax=Cucurbita moschata TaxID=3662 RepID=A0A6J1H4P7_CUCMO|nr:chromo domain-containing protein LHP1-like [Cucurbita moschata]